MQKKPWLINRCCLPILGGDANVKYKDLTRQVAKLHVCCERSVGLAPLVLA